MIAGNLGVGVGIDALWRLNAVASWSPLSLFAASEQGVWYDPSDMATMFQDSAGTTPVTATGQPVCKILDKSGRGNHATQATSARRPTLAQDGSGLYYLSFDGADDSLATSSVDFTATDEMTVVVGVQGSAADKMILELSADATATNGAFYLYYGATTLEASSRGTTARFRASDPYTNPAKFVATLRADISAPLLGIAINGGVSSETAASQGSGNYGNHPLYIGSRAGTGLRFGGRLYGLVVRGKTTAGTDLASAQSWMAARTGVTL